ncbi:MAG: rhodanese-like domain-containing protein [Acidimicrobiales bacterium]
MTFQNVSIVDYRSSIAADAQLVDVREQAEVAAGTLPQSVNIPVGELPARVGELDPARPVVLFCRSGGRSANAAEYLVDAGFGDVTNLTGGMLAWEDAGHDAGH